MLELRLGDQTIGLVPEGITYQLPDGDFVSPTQIGSVSGKDYVFVAYVPPPPPVLTPEEIREAMTPLSPRQLRLTLLSIGVTEADVDFKLVNDPGGMIEWKFATYFKRNHPLVDGLGLLFSITPEQIDSLWAYAQDL
jgi:hypothetical protein